MLKIFKFLKQEWISVLVILGLLVIQAYCDLSLPQYTADIVNVGISSYGIENAVPEEISVDKYNVLKLFMSDDEISKVDSFYSQTDEYNVPAYKLNTTNQDEINQLNDILKKPIVTVSSVAAKAQADAQAQGTTFTNDAMKQTFMQMANMPKEARLSTVDKSMEAVNKMGDSAINQMVSRYIIADKDALGIDKSVQQNHYILTAGAKMIGLAMVSMIVAIIVGFLAAKAAGRIGMNLRIKIFKNVVGFSSTEMDKFSTASLITRSTNDIQQVQMVTVMMLRMVLYAPILGIGGVLKVLRTETSMTWIIAVAVGVIMTVIAILLIVAMPRFKKQQILIDRVNLVAREILTGLPVIRAFSKERHEEARFDVANKELTKNQLFTSRSMIFMMPIIMFIMNGVSVMIIWFGGKGIDAGSLQVGDMMAFITYTMQIIMSFIMITMISIMLPRAGVAANRIDEVITTKLTIADPITPKKSTGNGTVKFNNVSFAYPNADDNVIEEISFTAEPGKTTAIIGSTGSGKSTLINLIPRLYDVSKGSITIDDVDVRDMTQHDLREMIGYVPQKAVLFSGTIASNIKFGNEDAASDEMERAARIAQAEDFINEKEEQYESSIAQGGNNVSGGQKQRLSIARAIAKKPKIFIFDDSFSALDYKTDVVLRKALKENTGDSTVIIVAQRISTILHADQIIVLEDGKIEGIGTHQKLLATNEIYRQIASSQLSEQDIDAIAYQQDEINNK